MALKSGTLWKHPSVLSNKIGAPIEILQNVDLSGLWSEEK